jgi:hypothetical protein
MIPGSNILNQALTIIAAQTITYYRALDRTLNNVGQNVTQYAPPSDIRGSFQPVPRRLYQQFGLDLQKDYWVFYTSNNLLDVQRDVSGDQIAFQDRRYQCESATAWYGIDGWVGMFCVMVDEDLTVDEALFGFNTDPRSNTYLNFENGNFISDGGT